LTRRNAFRFREQAVLHSRLVLVTDRWEALNKPLVLSAPAFSFGKHRGAQIVDRSPPENVFPKDSACAGPHRQDF